MFAQLMITALLTWMLAEILCLLILHQRPMDVLAQLNESARRAAADATPPVASDGTSPDLGGAPAVDTPADLDRRIRDRRRQLDAAREEFELLSTAAELTEDLEHRRDALTRAEKRLVEAEERLAS